MKKSNKILSLFLSTVVLLNIASLNTFAATNDTKTEFSSLEEFAASNTAELEAQGMEIIGGKAEVVTILNPLTRAKMQVYVDWDIAYSPSSGIGLCSYTRAYSTNLNCLLKKITGTFSWEDIADSDSGSYKINTSQIVPTYQITDAIETRDRFPSGTLVDCAALGDVGAVSEISGGKFNYSDTVTIP